MEILLLVIIGLLVYIAFFTPERVAKRKKDREEIETLAREVDEIQQKILESTNELNNPQK